MLGLPGNDRTKRNPDRQLIQEVNEMKAKIWEGKIQLHKILESYYQCESPSTGTVVVHAGRVKLPGKAKADMTHVILESIIDDPVDGLRRTGEQAVNRFPVNRVEIHHRLGKALPGENLLVVLVSAVKREPAFDACRWVVDEIKREEIIRLVERA